MALDIGTKRIGVALSDFLQITTNGVCCVPRTPEDEAIKSILTIASENKVTTIVVGLPLNMDGTQGFQADDCKNFAGKLDGFDIIFEDERLTSEQAEENLRQRKINFRKDKSLVDIESARIILEQYLGK